MTQPICMVISHDSSPVVARCLNSLKHHGWTAKKVAAVEGSSVSPKQWNDRGVAVLDRGKMPRRPGAQGCWLSHFDLWQQCEQTQTAMVIMEHDALVQSPWPSDLDIESQVVKLYRTAPCKHNTVTGIWSKGSHAYSVTPSQATRLIQHARTHGAQALDKHLGDLVVPWRFLGWDLVILNPQRGPSSTTRRTQ